MGLSPEPVEKKKGKKGETKRRRRFRPTGSRRSQRKRFSATCPYFLSGAVADCRSALGLKSPVATKP